MVVSIVAILVMIRNISNGRNPLEGRLAADVTDRHKLILLNAVSTTWCTSFVEHRAESKRMKMKTSREREREIG
jgi:hypothetical protein